MSASLSEIDQRAFVDQSLASAAWRVSPRARYRLPLGPFGLAHDTPGSSPPLPAIRLLGLGFADVSLHQAVSWLMARPAEAPFGYVVTPNADHLVRLAHSPELFSLYDHALLRLLDSRVVARLSGLLGLPAPRVVTGSDLTATLIREIREPVTIIGLDRAWVPRLGLHDVAHYNPPMGFDADPAAFRRTVNFALAHPARFTFLAVGSPRQERLAATIAATGSARGIGLCIGASLEFHAGIRQRAPLWMQHASLEWLHRLMQEPRRLAGRYLRDSPAIVTLLARERFG